MFCRAGTIVLRLEGDVILYALGTGEFDELNCEHVGTQAAAEPMLLVA